MLDFVMDTIAPAEMVARSVEIFGVESGLGARVPGTGHGPVALRENGLHHWLIERGLTATWQAPVQPGHAHAEGISVRSAVVGLCAVLADRIEDALDRKAEPAVVGGDHSCAIGTWSGAARHLRRRGPLGLVWVDAHMDAHVPETSPSGSLHGMPIACLLGHGDARLTGLAGGAPAVMPEHVCLVGVRSYEPAEEALLDRLGVRVIHMDEVNRRGLDAALEKAVGIAGAGTAGVGLSIDVDAIDPADAPGVGSPEPGGLRAAELVGALARCSRRAAFIGVEIAEYNPGLDRAGMTARVVGELFAAVHPVESSHG